ncbi:MAG: antitoxin VbhA family protein [Propionibacteriaceae bacterium]|nr:antitoxin VbhA family protein [Propionibacteriaceae bacterium]
MITSTDTTIAERDRRVVEAIYNSDLEGLSVSSAGWQDAREYIAGHNSSDELVARVRARYDLD